MNRLFEVSKKFLTKNASTILTCVEAAGVVATAVTAVKATPKALSLIEEAKQEKGEELTKWEVVKTATPTYIPAIILGTATVASIFGSNILNKRTQATIMSSYALLDQSFKNYKKKVTELYGEDANKEVSESIAKDQYEESEEKYDDEYEDDKQLFYETYSKRYFRASNETVMRTEYGLNRLIREKGKISLNMYYRMLGLEELDYGEYIGWSYDQIIEAHQGAWIIFEHKKVVMDDKLECWLIHFDIEPVPDFKNW